MTTIAQSGNFDDNGSGMGMGGSNQNLNRSGGGAGMSNLTTPHPNMMQSQMMSLNSPMNS